MRVIRAAREAMGPRQTLFGLVSVRAGTALEIIYRWSSIITNCLALNSVLHHMFGQRRGK